MACLTACSAAAACGHPVEHAQRSATIGRDFPYSCFWGVTWLTLSQPSACNDRGPQCALDRGGCNARHYRQHHHVRICHDIRGIWSGAHLGIRLGHVADRRRALNLDGNCGPSTPARASTQRQHGACSGSAVIGLAGERCRSHFGSTGAPLFLRRGESFCAGRAAPAINSPNLFWDCGVSKGAILSRSSVVANPLMLVVRFRPLRLLGMASPLHSACRE
jgi:hypothetical protein